MKILNKFTTTFPYTNNKLAIFLILIIFNLLQINLVSAKSVATVSDQEKRQKAEKVLKDYGQHLLFEQNKGQFNEVVLFKSSTSNAEAIFLEDKIRFAAYSKDTSLQKSSISNVWDMVFVGANKPTLVPKKEQITKYNYYTSYANGITGVSNFGELWYQNIYSNIDLRLYSRESGEMEYDYVVLPDGDPSKIKFRMDGVKDLLVNENGELEFTVAAGRLAKGKPYTYQVIDGVEIEIPSRYVIGENNEITFELLDKYNKNYELIIDPIILK